ncbi:large ribosomal subunit protein bL9m isoform X4 [Chamaea fasciata]|uniref:large ribosomal subunit protein bL9m isoform X4 n=1 Tax=Chamaea fasciata TaxID=190680 RepID=UPI00336A5C99
MLAPGAAGRVLSRALSLSHGLASAVVQRVWAVPLGRAGAAPRLHPRRHRVFRLLRDGKHAPRGDMELLLTRAVQAVQGACKGSPGILPSRPCPGILPSQPFPGILPSHPFLGILPSQPFPGHAGPGRPRGRGECEQASGLEQAAAAGAGRVPQPRERPGIPAGEPAGSAGAGEAGGAPNPERAEDPGVPAALPARGGDEEQRSLGAEPRHRGAALPQEPRGLRAPPRPAPAPGAHHPLGTLLV